MAEQQKAFNPDQAAMDAVSSIQAIMALGKLGAQKSAQIQDIIADTIRAALSHAEGEAVGTLTIDNYGSDEFRALLPAMDLEPGTYEVYTHPAPQVAGLTETAIKSSPAYRALHREKDHLLGLLKDQAPQVAVPEGYALVPEDMLTHFRDFHDAVKTLSKTADPDGYWEHQCEVCKRIESQLAAAPTAPAGEQQPDYQSVDWFGIAPNGQPMAGHVEKPVSDPDGFEQVLEELRKLHTEMTSADLVHEGSPEIVGYCVTGKQLDRMEWLLTCCASAGLNSTPAPDEREIAALWFVGQANRYSEQSKNATNRLAIAMYKEAADWFHGEAARLRAGQEGE